MHLMLFSTDRDLFDPTSKVSQRLSEYGTRFSEVHIIVFSRRSHHVPATSTLRENVHVYATQSLSRFLYGFDAIHLSRSIPRIDVVSAQDPFETGLASWIVARSRHIPLHLQVHTDLLSPAFIRHSLMNRFRVAIARFLFKRANGAYVVSPRIKAEIQAHFHPNITINVIPIFIDLARFKNRKKVYRASPPIVLLWVGRFEREKNPMLALYALNGVHAKGFPVKLVFMGKGRLEGKLRSLTRSLGLEHLVEFKSWQDPAEAYAESDILLMTSLYEGYGMVILEALASGIPVLATDVGIARDAGALIAHGDYTEALIAWIQEGSRTGTLRFDPYVSEDNYLDSIKEDLQVCVEAYRRNSR